MLNPQFCSEKLWARDTANFLGMRGGCGDETPRQEALSPAPPYLTEAQTAGEEKLLQPKGGFENGSMSGEDSTGSGHDEHPCGIANPELPGPIASTAARRLRDWGPC